MGDGSNGDRPEEPLFRAFDRRLSDGSDGEEGVPVLCPLLPSAERLLPYLRRIDAARYYTNHGALSAELESALARRLFVGEESVACAASGTAALIGAILAAAGRARPERALALLPAFTFAATAAAAEACGYGPYFVDVSEESWTLEPEALIAHPALARAGLVLPVAPFGRPVPHGPWREFRERTGIPVVIDAAASFDRLTLAPEGFVGPLPLTFSFHATKAFATGEGGAVVSTEIEIARRAAQALNFGVCRDRDPEMAGLNGKMSEYHAAVGLAELAGWENKRSALEAVVARYRIEMGKAGLAEDFLAAPLMSLTYAFYRCRNAAEAARVVAGLARQGVDTRQWYGRGLHHQTYFRDLPRDDLKATDAILPSLIGLPMAPDLPDAQISRVVAALAANLPRGALSQPPGDAPKRSVATAAAPRGISPLDGSGKTPRHSGTAREGRARKP